MDLFVELPDGTSKHVPVSIFPPNRGKQRTDITDARPERVQSDARRLPFISLEPEKKVATLALCVWYITTIFEVDTVGNYTFLQFPWTEPSLTTGCLLFSIL